MERYILEKDYARSAPSLSPTTRKLRQGGGVGGYTEVEEEAVDAGAMGGGDYEFEYLGEKELGLSEVTVTTTG